MTDLEIELRASKIAQIKLLAEQMVALKSNEYKDFKVNEEKAKSMGIKGFLMKPVLKKDLALTIRKTLDETAG